MSKKIINEEINKITIDFMERHIAYCILSNIAGMFWGNPGVGKSSVFEQVAKKLGYNLIDLRLSQREAVDLRGLPYKSTYNFKDSVNQAVVEWSMPDFIKESREIKEKEGKPTIFLFDEINHADSSTSAAAYQFIWDKKIGSWELDEKDRVFAAGNFENTGSYTNEMSEALANRFAHFYIKESSSAFCKWALRNNIDPTIIAYAQKNPHIFDQSKEETESLDDSESFENFDSTVSKDKGFLTPRTLALSSTQIQTIKNKKEELKKLLSEDSIFGDSVFQEDENDESEDILIALSGLIGKARAEELIMFMRIGEKLPDTEMILSNKDFEFEIEKSDIDIQYTLSNQLLSSMFKKYKELKQLMVSEGVKSISQKEVSSKIDKARKDFYENYQNMIIFCYKHFTFDLFILTVVVKLIREMGLIPFPKLISNECLEIIKNAHKKATK